MKTWLMELCPEIAEWQAEAIEEYHKSAVKLAREAVVQEPVSATQIPLTADQRKALSVDRHVEIGAATGVKEEPVAWRTFDGEGGYDYRTYDDNENYAEEWAKRNPKHIGWVEPLYTHHAPVNQRIAELEAALDVALEFFESYTAGAMSRNNAEQLAQEALAKLKETRSAST